MPFVTSGVATMPPAPVVAGDPAPSRRNHVSIVNVVTPRPGAAPKVTRSSSPSNRRADALGVPAAPAWGGMIGGSGGATVRGDEKGGYGDGPYEDAPARDARAPRRGAALYSTPAISRHTSPM